MTTFTELNVKTKKANLIKNIIEKCTELNAVQLKQIAEFQWQADQRTEDVYDPKPSTYWYDKENFFLYELNLKIEIFEDAKKFNSFSLQEETGLEHSWAGDNKFYSYTRVVLGDIVSGHNIDIQYSNNGSMGTPTQYYRNSEFSLNQIQVVVKKDIRINSFNNNDINEVSWRLGIYLPEDEEEFEKDPLIRRIIQDFRL